ncbi:MAG TPA: YggS family pyridoxal phosphate enzyme [Acidimicrobiales bacterium]|nr:YggS family pyridoxal phosphate enzyme [Acidimicrobiales bacterium]
MADAAADVRLRIFRAGADPEAVTLVAVTKGHGPDAVRAAVAAGLTDLGENRAAELVDKAAAVGHGPRWHFLGAVQRNKIGALAHIVDTWQSVDRPEEADSIARANPGARLLVEVCLAPGPGRAGCAPEEAEALVAELRRRRHRVEGLMAVGPPGEPELARPGFNWLAAEARRLGLEVVSMGMTDDLEVAVQEGSTMIRVGRALFGDRPPAPSP